MRMLLLGLSLAATASFAGQTSRADRNESKKVEYETIEILKFTARKNLEVPPAFMARLQEQLPFQLTGTRRFKRVSNFEDPSTDPGSPGLQMKGTLIEYDPGSRTKRYLVGFGAGTGEAVAHIEIVKVDTNEPIFERDITARLSGGAYGGSTKAFADQLAKEIAEVTKRVYY